MHAVSSAFIEPTKLFFAVQRNDRAVDDADVHAPHVFAGILLAILDVRIAIPADLEDRVVGITPFLRERRLHPCYEQMSLPQHFGKSYLALRTCTEAIQR